LTTVLWSLVVAADPHLERVAFVPPLPFVRTTLLLASGLALIGFLAYATAPPRLSGFGINDTVSGSEISLDHGLVSALYNPYAAVPSIHVCYAVVVAANLLRYSRRRLVHVLALMYPPFVLFVVVATGNHFFFDAVAGALVAALASGFAILLLRQVDMPQRLAFPSGEPGPVVDRLGA
jgi:hypothetical protein